MNTETKSSNDRGAMPDPRGCCCAFMRYAPENAREILERRYANGEISKDQYDQIKRDIEPDRSLS